MEEEILYPTDQENIEETNEIPTLKILYKREGNKLLVANAGCHSLIGIVENIDGRFYIESSIDSFKTEKDAIEYLIR